MRQPQLHVDAALADDAVPAVDAAVRARVVVRVLLHDLARALHDAADAALAHEHVVRLFGEHEAARAREGVEAALGQAGELVLAVAVGEEAEHEEAEPVRRLLVERAEDARLVAVARASLQQRLRLLAAVAPEVGLQQVDHRPQVAALLDVHLEEVAQVVERGAGAAEVPLLLDGGRLGVALGDDQPAQRAAVLAGHVLPRVLALVIAEGDRAVGLRLGEEDAPAVVGHLEIAELRPALRIHADRRAQVDVARLVALRPHVAPPLEEPRLPFLQRALQAPVAGEVDVVRDALQIVDGPHHTLLRSKSLRSPVPYTWSAPFGPTAFGRWKIQFCQDRKSTRLNSSHVRISYAVFCLKKKKEKHCSILTISDASSI